MAEYSNLIEKYTAKIKEDPAAKVFAPLAEIYRKTGMYSEAINVLNSGLRHNQDYALGLIVLATCYFEIEEYQKAYNTISPHVKNNTDNVKLLTVYAHICEKMGYVDESLRAYKTILFLNPKHEEAASYVARYEDIIYEDEAGFEKVATFDTDKLDEEAENWSQVSLVEKEEVEKESGEDNKEDEEAEPAPYFSHTLVDLYLKQGARDRAIELLESALELNPSDVKTAEKLEQIKAQESVVHGHDELMKIFDDKVEKINIINENSVEKVKMAFDLFMIHLNKKRNEYVR